MIFIQADSESPKGVFKLWAKVIRHVKRIQNQSFESHGLFTRITVGVCGRIWGYDSILDSHRTNISYILNKNLI
jgi:hypothetical protein